MHGNEQSSIERELNNIRAKFSNMDVNTCYLDYISAIPQWEDLLMSNELVEDFLEKD